MSEHIDLSVVEGLVVRPGDTLILRVSSTARFTEQIETSASSLKQRLAGVEVVVIGGVEQMAVHRPEGD